jgi:hypothetical protein
MRITEWLLVSIGAALFVGCGGTDPPPFRPVADMKQLMNDIIDPAADDVWDASGTIVTKEGEEERGPKTAEEWAEVRKSALVLTEAGNLLMMVPRAKDGGQWMTLSRALVDKGEEAIRAADARSTKRMFDVGGEVYQTCLNCHQQYMPAIRDALK